MLLERLATLTDRLTRLLSDENQESISGILANTNRISEQLAETSPEVKETLVTTLRGTLAQSTETLAAFEDTLRSTDAMINDEGGGLAAEMRRTMVAARGAAEALEATLNDTRPAARDFATTTLAGRQCDA